MGAACARSAAGKYGKDSFLASKSNKNLKELQTGTNDGMSKFFNETRTVGKTDSVPATANVNIQDLVSSLKEHMESNGATASHSGQIDLEHLLQPLEEST